MKMIKMLVGAVVLAASMQANAVEITGTFILDPATVGGNATGPTLSGTFTTAETAGATTSMGITTVAVTAISVIVPPAPGQELTVVDFSFGPIAILPAIGSNVISYLEGVASRTVAGITYELSLTTEPGGMAIGSFTSTGGVFTTNYSGLQVIPEPSAIALMGAALVAFGFAGRRRKSNSGKLAS